MTDNIDRFANAHMRGYPPAPAAAYPRSILQSPQFVGMSERPTMIISPEILATIRDEKLRQALAAFCGVETSNFIKGVTSHGFGNGINTRSGGTR
jgi:hypothetical protein